MCIAMYKSVLKYHGGKDVNQVFSRLYGVDSHLNYLFFIINFGSLHELHGNNSLITILFVVVRNIDIWIVMEVLFTS
jgi:hypothetical protein